MYFTQPLFCEILRIMKLFFDCASTSHANARITDCSRTVTLHILDGLENVSRVGVPNSVPRKGPQPTKFQNSRTTMQQSTQVENKSLI